MAKKKTSRKRKPFSINDMPIVRLKDTSDLAPYDPGINLRDPEFISKALVQCLWEGDDKAFKEILRWHYEAVNTAAVLRRIGLSKRTFYQATSAQGNPSFATISKILRGLKKVA